MIVGSIMPEHRDGETGYFERWLENREPMGAVVDESARYEGDQV